jgi:hypothetical protein
VADIDHEWWKKTPAELDAILRDDQKAAFACAAELMNEAMKAESPIAVGVFWLGEKDLLGDVPVMFATNLKRDGVARMIDHAYRRFVKVGRINPQEAT